MDIPNFGIFSLLPPVITIVCAFITKQVLLSLFVGCFIAATMLASFNPFLGLLDTFRDFVIAPLTPFNVSVLILVFVIGGFSNVLDKGGAATAFAEAVSQKVKTRKSAQTVSWAASCSIFFTDGSPLIIGPVCRPLTDKLKVSREKLAYIIDSTGCTIPSLHPMSSWGAFIVGLIAVQFEALGYDGNPFNYFIATVPYQLYPIAAVSIVLITILTGFDFGPMVKAEKRALKEGKLYRDGAVLLREESKVEIPEHAKYTIWTLLLPLLSVIVITLVMFAYTGGFFTTEVTLLESFQTAQAVPSLIYAFTVGGILGAILVAKTKAFSFKETMKIWMKGVEGNVTIALILILAWGIGRASQAVGAPAFIVSVTEGFLTPTMLYIAIFVAASFTSFATGTSWGTFSIFIPISVPLAYAIGAPIAPAIAVAVSGGIFGDHCSPISDTTIMSALGGSCDILDHVKTQMPYAIVAAIAGVVGYFFVGFTGSAIAGLLALLVSLIIFAFLLHKFWAVKVGDDAKVA